MPVPKETSSSADFAVVMQNAVNAALNRAGVSGAKKAPEGAQEEALKAIRDLTESVSETTGETTDPQQKP